MLISAKHQEIPESVLFTRHEGGTALVGAAGISAPAVTSFLSHEVLELNINMTQFCTGMAIKH